ncbi:MAG: universal stress protein [Actinomycetota bacterium]
MSNQQHRAQSPYVVVGVDESQLSRAGFRWAYEYARVRGLSVHAVHAWTYPTAASLTGEFLLPNIDMGADTFALLRQITVDELGQEALSRVELEAPLGVPGPVLVERSVGAELLVVGASGANPMTRLLIGSTSAYVAQHAGCPVVIARSRVPAPTASPEPVANAIHG